MKSEKKPRSVLEIQGQPLVGFDLGTTFSKAAVIDANYLPRRVPVGLPDSIGPDRYQMPSVGLLRSDKLIVGDELPAIFDEEDVPIRLPKRFLADPRPRFPEDRPRFSAAEVCAQLLKRLKARTEKYIGRPVRRVVLTIPPSFGSRQRSALLKAAAWADLEVVDLVEEPVAAAVYDWMVEKSVKPGDNREPLGVKYSQIRAGQSSMLVFDLGGGTLDISLLRAEGTQIDVLESWAGGEFLGGADFTQAIADWIASEIRGRTGFDPVYHPSAKDKINQAAELIKKELTERPSTTRKWKKRGFELEITRNIYAGIVEPLMSRSETAIYQAAKSAEKQLRGPVKHLLVVGAGSRAHGVREMIDRLDPYRVGSREFPADGQFYVALGAATMAWLKAQNENVANNSGPQSKSHRVFQLRRKTGLNLGIRAWDSDAKDHVLRVILKANTMLPAEKTVSFGKVKTHQSSIRLKVLESPTILLSDAKSVGEFVVELDKGQEDQQELKFQSETSIEKDPDREAEIKVTLAYDITGQVRVSVLDRRTAKKASKDLEPVPFDVEVAEASVAADPLAPPPAVATQEDEIKRFKRQLQELSGELERVKKAKLQELERELNQKTMKSEAELPSNNVTQPLQSPFIRTNPEPVFAEAKQGQLTTKLPESKPPGEIKPARELKLDVHFADADSGPIQTLFDDDSAVLEALSGVHQPVSFVRDPVARPQPKTAISPPPPLPRQATPPVQISSTPLVTSPVPTSRSANENHLEIEDDELEIEEEELLDLNESPASSVKPEELLVIDDEQSVAGLKLDLGLQLDMKDERLQGLTYAFKLVMMELVKKPQWTWVEFAEYCQNNHTAPKVVFERLNQWSNQKYQEFILRREKDHLVVNRQLLQK